MAGAGQGKPSADAAARRAGQQHDRERRSDTYAADRRHRETVRAAALQAAVTALTPHWAPFAHAEHEVVYCAEPPQDLMIGPPGAGPVDHVLALAERFERFITEAGPPLHPALADGPPVPGHPGLR